MRGFMTASEELYHLFCEYVEVYNKALDKNQQRFPFKQIFQSAHTHDSGKVIAVHIINKSNQIKKYAVSLKNGHIVSCPIDISHFMSNQRHWDIELHKIKNVIKQRDAYIDNPAKLDWEWMYDNNSSRH